MEAVIYELILQQCLITNDLHSLFCNFTSFSDLCFVANRSFGHFSRYTDKCQCFAIFERFDTTLKFFFCNVIFIYIQVSLVYVLIWSVSNVRRSSRKKENVLLRLLYPFSCICDFSERSNLCISSSSPFFQFLCCQDTTVYCLSSCYLMKVVEVEQIGNF